MKKLIEVENAFFGYKKNEVILSDISLTVEKGDCLCLLGANGSGKTTLLNCINGNLKIVSGKILLKRKDISYYSVRDFAKIVGVVYQDHVISFPYPALEVVTMGRAPHLKAFRAPSSEDSDIAYAIMKDMGISHLAHKKYSQISGGERQLVLIARTLCQQPEIILFDEPTSHLDFKNQAIVMETIKNLSQKGLTMVMTSHFPSHGWQVANKVAVMGERKILAVGTPQEIMTEESLSKTYGVDVRVITREENGRKSFFCEPILTN